MATDYFTTRRSNFNTRYIYSRAHFRSYQPDRGLYTLDTELDDSTRCSSRLRRSKSGFTLKTVGFHDGPTVATTATTASNPSGTIVEEEKKKGLSGLKKKMSTLFVRRNAKKDSMAEVIEGDEDDLVPGCMPMTGLSKKKSFTLSKVSVEEHIGAHGDDDQVQSRSRHNSVFGIRSRKFSSLSKQTLTILTDSTAPPSSTCTDEATVVGTPQTPIKPHRVMSPPPLLPSPGFSKDNSEMWYTNLMQQLEQPHLNREVLRRPRSFSGFRSSMTSLEFDAMLPPSPGIIFPWQPEFRWDDAEDDDDFAKAVVTEKSAYVSIEDDAESVYRACEAMGGTGIVF